MRELLLVGGRTVPHRYSGTDLLLFRLRVGAESDLGAASRTVGRSASSSTGWTVALADAEAEDAANADLGDAEVAAAEAAIAHLPAPAAVPELGDVPPVPEVPPVSGASGLPELAPGEEVPAADR